MNSVGTRHLLAALLTAGTAAIAAPSMAQEPGNWIVRGRVIHVTPNDRSGEVTTLAGSGVGVGDDTTAELDITYMLRPNWGLELILGTTQHDLTGKGTIANLGKIGKTALLPPTLTLQYHFAPKTDVRPYAGIGVNYSKFYNERAPTRSTPAWAAPPTSIWTIPGAGGAGGRGRGPEKRLVRELRPQVHPDRNQGHARHRQHHAHGGRGHQSVGVRHRHRQAVLAAEAARTYWTQQTHQALRTAD